jgi:hypothetical protein
MVTQKALHRPERQFNCPYIFLSFDPKLLMRPPAEVLDVGVTVAQAAPALEHCAKAQDGGLVQPLGDELNADR